MAKKKHRVCIVSPLYHPSLGGLGRQAQLLTERLAEEGVDIFVIARRMKGMPPAVFSGQVKVYRVGSWKPELHNFEKITALNLLVSLNFALSCVAALCRKRGEYDIVHFHGASLPLFVALPPLKLLGKKVVAKVASAELGIEAGSLAGRYGTMGKVVRMLLTMVDRFVATTAEIEGGLMRDGIKGTKVARIPNFIDSQLFVPASLEDKKRIRAELGYGEGPLVTFSGRFIARKGIDHLLEAWKVVEGECPEARLLLLGDGPLLGEMKKRAAFLGITDSLSFRGHVARVTDYLRGADLFVLPSLQEGMPNALLEAMACGLPAVATRIGGAIDIIRSGINGVLVEPGNPEALAAALVHALKDGKGTRALAVEALRTIREHYTLDTIAPRYRSLYENIVSSPRRGG